MSQRRIRQRRKQNKPTTPSDLLPPGKQSQIELSDLTVRASTPGTAAYEYLSGGKPLTDLKNDPRVLLSIPYEEGPWVYFQDQTSMQMLNPGWTPEEYAAFLDAMRGKASAA